MAQQFSSSLRRIQYFNRNRNPLEIIFFEMHVVYNNFNTVFILELWDYYENSMKMKCNLQYQQTSQINYITIAVFVAVLF